MLRLRSWCYCRNSYRPSRLHCSHAPADYNTADAGHYVPAVAHRIWNASRTGEVQQPIKLKGLAIGDRGGGAKKLLLRLLRQKVQCTRAPHAVPPLSSQLRKHAINPLPQTKAMALPTQRFNMVHTQTLWLEMGKFLRPQQTGS